MKETVQDKLSKVLVKKALENQHNSCYVLITCGEPSEEGKMEVELTYEGDLSLVAYLLESSQGILDEQLKSREE